MLRDMTMKMKDESVIYLTKAELEAFKAEEARERMELVRRVESGEITAMEANREASIFKGRVPGVLEQPVNYHEVFKNLKGLRLRKKSHGR